MMTSVNLVRSVVLLLHKKIIKYIHMADIWSRIRVIRVIPKNIIHQSYMIWLYDNTKSPKTLIQRPYYLLAVRSKHKWEPAGGTQISNTHYFFLLHTIQVDYYYKVAFPGANLRETLLTQCRSSVGVGKPSPLKTCPRCPPQAAHVISILLPSGSALSKHKF